MPNPVPTPNPPLTRPVPAAVAVVLREGRVLLVRRSNPPNAGCWGFPGGKIEVGETVQAAATRELAEETSVSAEAERVLTAFDVFHHDEGGQLVRHFVLIAVLCTWIAGEPIAGDDAADARWFRLEDLDESVAVLNANVVRIARDASRVVRAGD